MPFFSYDVELCMLSVWTALNTQAPQFELHTHSRLLVVNINRKYSSFILFTQLQFLILLADWFKFISVQIGIHSNTEAKFPVQSLG